MQLAAVTSTGLPNNHTQVKTAGCWHGPEPSAWCAVFLLTQLATPAEPPSTSSQNLCSRLFFSVPHVSWPRTASRSCRSPARLAAEAAALCCCRAPTFFTWLPAALLLPSVLLLLALGPRLLVLSAELPLLLVLPSRKPSMTG